MAKKFGAWLVALRKRLDLTQIELADAIGCSRTAIQKFESGKRRPSKAMAERMAAILQVPEGERPAFLKIARQSDPLASPVVVPPEVPHAYYQTRSVSDSNKADWGEAPDVSRFYGRQSEVDQLCQWLTEDRCKLIAVLGMGGIGKTALATLTAMLMREQYAAIIWRSLRNALPLTELLSQIIGFFSDDDESEPPSSVEQQTAQLMEHLRRQPCLLVLDNFETVLASDRPGHYLPGFEGYGQLLKHLGEGRHQSTLVITSREKPKELIPLAANAAPVRTLALPSLDLAASHTLLHDRNLRGSEHDWAALHARCSGNPLALQIVSERIRELFADDIAQFLQEDTLLFGGIADLIAQQHSRLSHLEQEVMFWLAIEREPVTAEELRANFVRRPSLQAVLTALHDLRQRSLVERVKKGFTLQNVVLEYYTATLVEQVCTEIAGGSADFLQRYSLLKAAAKSYVRESQRNLILAPIAQRLIEESGDAAMAEQLRVILAQLRHGQARKPGYAGGNLLNLLVQLGYDLRGWDFSKLAVWQADLRNVTAQGVNFQQSDLSQSAFTDTFTDVFCVAFSPDGQWLAASTMGSAISIWRVSDGKLLLTWLAHAVNVWSVVFSPNGRILASCSDDKSLRLWDASDGKHLGTLLGHTKDVYSLCFSPDGSILASGSADRTVRLWDSSTGVCLHTLVGHSADVWSLAFSSNGDILISGSGDHTIRLWNGHTGEYLYTLDGHSDAVLSVSSSPDDRTVVSSGSDRTVRLWDYHTGECLHILRGHTGSIRSVSFSPDGHTLASSSNDQTVRLWDSHTGECLNTLREHTNWVRTVCFSPDGNVLASGSDDQTIRLWDRYTGKCLHALQGYANPILSVSFSPDDRTLASSSRDRMVRLWDTQTGACMHTLQGHAGSVRCAYFSPDGSILASGSRDRTVRLWDRRMGKFLHTLQGHNGPINSICFSPDGDVIASSSNDDQKVLLWNTHSGQRLQTLYGHSGWVRTICFSPDRVMLASGSDDQTVRLWDIHSGRCLQTLQGHTGWIRTVCFSPDGSILATGSDDTTVRLWDTQTGQCLGSLRGHSGWISSVCFSFDGKLLASGGGSDAEVRLWDKRSGQCLHALRGHTGTVWSTCFSPTDLVLASSGDDLLVRVWDPISGHCLHELQGHRNAVLAISFSHDGEVLASGSTDETIRIWDIHTGECQEVLRSERPYEGMNIAEVIGLTTTQIAALKRLGSLEAWTQSQESDE